MMMKSIMIDDDGGDIDDVYNDGHNGHDDNVLYVDDDDDADIDDDDGGDNDYSDNDDNDVDDVYNA